MTSRLDKSAEAFRTISEVAKELGLATHVLRFWESKFPQIKPMKRAGGRRYYRPDDVAFLRHLQTLLHDEGYTIKGAQKLLREEGTRKFIEDGLMHQQLEAEDDASSFETSDDSPEEIASPSMPPQGSLFDSPASPSPASLFHMPPADAPEPDELEPRAPQGDQADQDGFPESASFDVSSLPEPEPIETSLDPAPENILIQTGLNETQRSRLQDIKNELIALKEKLNEVA